MRPHSLVVCAALTACPGQPSTTDATASGDPTGATQDTGTTSSTTVDATTVAPTTGGPGTGSSTTGSSSSTGDPTTGGPDPVVTRVVYYTFVEVLGQPNVAAMRYVEVVDGVAAPPVTILDPPGETLRAFDARLDRAWAPVYSSPDDPPQLWLIDTTTLVPHEVGLPPAIERVVQAFVSRGDGHLIVRGGLLDNGMAEDMTFYVCAIGDEGDCALLPIEPATGPTTYVSGIHEVSSATGRIWYETRELMGTGVSVLQGDIDAPEAATTLISFPDTTSGLMRVSLDEETLYFSLADGDEHHAMDISADPPGPLVPIHPPLTDTVRLIWADDESAFLVWNGSGLKGDLYRVALDGATAGPMELFEVGVPAQVWPKPVLWTADKARVLFRSEHETPMFQQLYIADAAAPGSPPLRVNGPLGPDGSISGAHLRGDPDHVIYYGQETDQTPAEIYRARISPPAEIHKLNGPLAEGSYLQDGAFDVSSDGQRVVYAGEEVANRTDLFLVDIDGEVPAPALNLTSALPADVEVRLLGHLAPHAGEVYFAGAGPLGERRGLYMVPLSPVVGAPVQISDDGETMYDYSVLPPL